MLQRSSDLLSSRRTLGPKGLRYDAGWRKAMSLLPMMGNILEKMDVTHPAARLMIQVARSQQRQIGDGTTTATVLAGALVKKALHK